MVRDIVVARLKEIQDIKASVRKKIAKEISFFIRNDFKKGSKWVGSSDVTYGARIIKEISDESFHAERGLATLTYLSEYVFSGIEAEVKGSLEEGVEINCSRMSRRYYCNLLFRNLSLIDSYAARSIEIPKNFSTRNNDKIGHSSAAYVGKGGISSFNGLEQGPRFDPMGFYCIEYLFDILGVEVNKMNFIKNKYFFKALGGSDTFYIWFIERKVCAPINIDLGEVIFGRKMMNLIGVEIFKGVKPGNEGKCIHFYYCNLNGFFGFVDSVKDSEVKGVFFNFFGNNDFVVEVIKGVEVVVVKVPYACATEAYRLKRGEIAYKAYKASRKKALTFVRECLLSSPSSLLDILLYRFCFRFKRFGGF